MQMLRHESTLPRLPDGSIMAIHVLQMLHKRRLILISCADMIQQLENSCTEKPRLHFLYEGSEGTRISAIQGHTACRVKIDDMGWNEVNSNRSPWLYHGTAKRATESIVRHGLIPGGLRVNGARHESFFSGADPRLKRDPSSQYQPYVFDAQMHVVVDMAEAELAGCVFYHSPGKAILCRQTVPPSCIVEIRCANSGCIEWADDGGQATKAIIQRETPSFPTDIPGRLNVSDVTSGAEQSAREQEGCVTGPGTIAPPFFKTTKHSIIVPFDDPMTGVPRPRIEKGWWIQASEQTCFMFYETAPGSGRKTK